MGHFRTGALTRTKKWRAVVSAVGVSTGISESSVADIAEKTLDASGQALRKLPQDQAVKSCFQFLLALAVAGQSTDVKSAAQGLGIIIGEEPTKLQLSKALREWLGKENIQAHNPEFASLVRKATLDTIAAWLNKHLSQTQKSLFPQIKDPFQPWRVASDGRGFCERSRMFFSNFTSLYLNYFLSRTASSQLRTITDREQFATAISSGIDVISKHAFETSKIVQSFSAGWFNNNAIGRLPSQLEIEGFLRHSFEKIREELRREKETPQ